LGTNVGRISNAGGGRGRGCFPRRRDRPRLIFEAGVRGSGRHRWCLPLVAVSAALGTSTPTRRPRAGPHPGPDAGECHALVAHRGPVFALAVSPYGNSSVRASYPSRA
jgi:hypothetical protein